MTKKKKADLTKIQLKLSAIKEKISSMAGTNNKELRTLKSIQKELQQEIKKAEGGNKSHIVWPYSSSINQKPRTNGEIREIVIRIENNEILSPEEKKGIVKRSPLLDIHYFNFVRDVPVDYMHAVCIGVVKRLIELTFNVGEPRARVTTRKLSSTELFNALMQATKLPHECSRRARDLKFAVMKATEFRNILIFFFPHVLQCIEPDAKERKVWLLLVYLVRACIIPANEFKNIDLAIIEFCGDKFYSLYEALFGSINCTYNTHVVGTHMLEMRFHGPLTMTSSFPFESFYGELRQAFVPGTQSPLKQIFEKVMAKKVLENHVCQIPIFFSDHDTALECNTLIYTFSDLQYHLYKVVKEEKEMLKCRRITHIPATFSEVPRKLDWAKIGVFVEVSMEESIQTIEKRKVAGKIFKVSEYLITCPNSVLREK